MGERQLSNFRNCKLWQATLAARENDGHATFRERLRVAYEIFWKRSAEIAQRISTDLPGLTLHDEAHLNAIWDRASQLTGDAYPINPLEAFVFGGAVLLHDVGHTVAAYEGGISEITGSVEYRDAIASLLRAKGANPPEEKDLLKPPREIAEIALFRALRICTRSTRKFWLLGRSTDCT